MTIVNLCILEIYLSLKLFLKLQTVFNQIINKVEKLNSFTYYFEMAILTTTESETLPYTEKTQWKNFFFLNMNRLYFCIKF